MRLLERWLRAAGTNLAQAGCGLVWAFHQFRVLLAFPSHRSILAHNSTGQQAKMFLGFPSFT